MLAKASNASFAAVRAPAAAPAAVARAPARSPSLRTRALLPAAHELAALAAAGDVDAPIGVVVAAAAVVTLVATAIVPIALKPGDEAAKKIFAAKEAKPLDKKKGTAGGKKTARR